MGDPGAGVKSFGEAINCSMTGFAVMGGGSDVGIVIIGDPGEKMGCALIGGETGVTTAGKSSFLPSVSVTFSTLPGIQEAFPITCAAFVGATAGCIDGSIVPSSERTDSSMTSNNPSGGSKSGGGPSSKTLVSSLISFS